MTILQKANPRVTALLRPGKRKEGQEYRLTRYLLRREAEGGVLFFNTLTCELLLLTPEEAADALNNDELLRRGFVVPADYDEMRRAKSMRELLRASEPPRKETTSYLVYTTLDCNARCYYCYEADHPHCYMSKETALKSAAYMAEHCGGKKIHISWFGGEPLCNTAAMDTICTELKNRGVEYGSNMISNSYLFDAETADKAADLWHIGNIQVTLDGTEEVYNRTKAYVAAGNTSPFRTVLDNIGRMLDKNIGVSIRLNVSDENAEDLGNLIDQLCERFGGRKGFSIYTHILFSYDDGDIETRDRVVKKEAALREKLQGHGIRYTENGGKLPRSMRLYHCMADRASTLNIHPDGKTGCCEHYYNSDFTGTLDSEERDEAVLAAFREQIDELPRCSTCSVYPQCVLLKKCAEHKCFESTVTNIEDDILRGMGAAWERYMEKLKEKKAEEEENGAEEEPQTDTEESCT